MLDVLISSLRVAKRLQDLTKEELTDLFQVAVKVQNVMEQVHSTNSSTVCIQDGALAGQTVPVRKMLMEILLKLIVFFSMFMYIFCHVLKVISIEMMIFMTVWLNMTEMKTQHLLET